MGTAAFDRFLSTPEMAGVFSEASLLQAMLDFEAVLAASQAAEGLVPPAAAQAIAAACRVERIDIPGLLASAGRAGSLAIPLVQQLREHLAHEAPDAAASVHLGSTSQDVIDTAMVLCTRRALALVDRDLGALAAALLSLAEAHVDTPVLARTLMQPASVTSMGLKLALWLQPLLRSQARLHAAGAAALQLQLGGAVGTLAGMEARGTAVAARMAAALRLPAPGGAWHTQRDEWVRLATEAGVLCGTLGKMARDWSLMAQGEVGELAEPAEPGRGGSSAMAHKHNPVAAMVALAAAQRVPQRVAALLQAMVQEHERGLGGWQAELAEWCGLWLSVHGSLKALADAAAGLQLHAGRMRENISRFQATDALFDPVHAEPAARRAVELLQQLGPQAAALAAVRPWHDWLPTP